MSKAIPSETQPGTPRCFFDLTKPCLQPEQQAEILENNLFAPLPCADCSRTGRRWNLIPASSIPLVTITETEARAIRGSRL